MRRATLRTAAFHAFAITSTASERDATTFCTPAGSCTLTNGSTSVGMQSLPIVSGPFKNSCSFDNSSLIVDAEEGNSSNQITSSNESTPISNNQTKPDIQQSPLPTFGGLPDVSYLMRDPSVAAALLYGRLPPALINQLDTIRQNAYPKPEEPITNESNPKQFDCQFIDCQVKTIEHYHCPFPECKKNLLR